MVVRGPAWVLRGRRAARTLGSRGGWSSAGRLGPTVLRRRVLLAQRGPRPTAQPRERAACVGAKSQAARLDLGVYAGSRALWVSLGGS